MKLKKVLAAAMAVTMLGSLTACGGSGGSGEAAAAKAPAGRKLPQMDRKPSTLQ